MSLIIVSDLTKSYGAELIFSGVSFRVDAHDRIGLVGPNGAGKTTLLKLLAGRLQPDGGSVVLAQGTRVGYQPQMAELQPHHSLYEEMMETLESVREMGREMESLAGRMGDPEVLAQPEEYSAVLERYSELQARFEHAGGYTLDQRVSQVLDGLGFTREQQSAPASHLSGGQQTRAALGKLLLQDPDLLLLDEPTNHLDLAALEWLENYLTAWHGAVIVVSHDRYFLDRVTQRTIEVNMQRAEAYPGNYTKFVQLRAERRERWGKEFVAQQEYIARTEEFVRRYKAGQRSKEARGRQNLLDRLERIDRPPEDDAIKFRMKAQIESGQIVLTTEKLVIGYAKPRPGESAATVRVEVPDMQVRRGERIGLIGSNGAGKTTLLRTLVGQIGALEGRLLVGHNVQIGYYAQTHENLTAHLTVLEEIRRASTMSEESARTYLGRFLFSGDDVFKPISALSGGERSRVALAKLTLQGANFLVLDEPTNHLDLPARQALEDVLSEYDGTLIFVSHDRYFTDALATTLWILEDGAIRTYAGNYSAFRNRRGAPIPVPEPVVERPITAATNGKSATTKRAASGGSTRSVDKVEAEIAVLEEKLRTLEAELAGASSEAAIDRIAALGAEYDDAQARLQELYDEWQVLAS